MCVVAFALGAHPRYRLVLAGNRDEVYRRPAAPLAAWADGSGIVAGRDLEAGGTWLGATAEGRWAVLTNVRDPLHPRASLRSRGALAADFLRGDASALAYARAVHDARDAYDGFNLVVGDARAVVWVSTRAETPHRLGPGVYGLSNDRLDGDWPKVRRVRSGLRAALASDPVQAEALFALLDDPRGAPDAELPDTGVGLAMERALAPVRIHLDGYGTRVSTALTIDAEGHVRMAERTWRPDGTPGPTVETDLAVPPGA